MNRRHFLLGSLCLAALGGATTFATMKPPPIPGNIVGANATLGHRLRQGNFPPVTKRHQTQVVIVGGGIAGLSAAWALQRAGFKDYILLELEEAVGGNAACGSNAVSAYPWGAHYVPLLTTEAKAAQALFEELGVITGWQNGLPVYNEYFLCADPQERLYLSGRWQEGLVPQLGTTAKDRGQYEAFFAAMEQFRRRRSADGKRAFAIPLAYCADDADLLALDTISMADYLTQQGWDSPALRWYVDYCCRDDYGAPAEAISAWAGIHYFAARDGHAANSEAQAVVTWPEGNGWLARQMRARLTGTVLTQRLAYGLDSNANSATVRCLVAPQETSEDITAAAVIMAVPHFVASRLQPTLAAPAVPHQYSPWMVANLTLDMLPQGRGHRLAWDNVIYRSPLLGYVVATHQHLNRVQKQTVLTYYWPLDHLPPTEARREALARPYAVWQSLILKELLRVHPELIGHIKQIDVWLWGHGMIRPVPNYIWNPARQNAETPPVFHAHSDISGLSIFEEAQYQGVRAAEAVLNHLKHPFQSLL